jgi:hypothetical protein
MNRDLTQKLVRRFLVLYQDYHSPMSQTSMCWGFDHGDGWFEIIWQLSLAIEEELRYSRFRKRWFLFKKSFFRSWNKFLNTLSSVRLDKQVRAGSGTKEDPYRWVVVEKAPRDWLAKAASVVLPERATNGIRFSWQSRIQKLGFKAFIVLPNTGFAVQQVILLIEDTAEIQLVHANLVRFEARRAQSGVPAIAIRDLLRASPSPQARPHFARRGPRRRSL